MQDTSLLNASGNVVLRSRYSGSRVVNEQCECAPSSRSRHIPPIAITDIAKDSTGMEYSSPRVFVDDDVLGLGAGR